MKGPVTVTKDRVAEVMAEIRKLTTSRVLVGVPAEETDRDPEGGERAGPINNAALAYIHENGGTIQHPGGTRYITDAVEGGRRVGTRFVGKGFVGETLVTGPHSITIPARPFMSPGVEEALPQIVKRMRSGATRALNGDRQAASQTLEAVGLIAQTAIRKRIASGDFVPLAPATLEARRRRGRTGTRPLIDTGQMRNAITYVIRRRGN